MKYANQNAKYCMILRVKNSHKEAILGQCSVVGACEARTNLGLYYQCKLVVLRHLTSIGDVRCVC